MTFIQVLQSDFYYIVEAIEHGCSDKEVINGLVQELKEKTGYQYTF